jgi:hypothetical protein
MTRRRWRSVKHRQSKLRDSASLAMIWNRIDRQVAVPSHGYQAAMYAAAMDRMEKVRADRRAQRQLEEAQS